MTEIRKVLCCVYIFCVDFVFCALEPGIWKGVTFNQMDYEYRAVTKSVYEGTKISVRIDCTTKHPDTRLWVGWVLRYSPCAGEYSGLNRSPSKDQILYHYFTSPQIQLFPELNYTKVEYMKSEGEIFECNKDISLAEFSGEVIIEDAIMSWRASKTTAAPASTTITQARHRRAAEDKEKENKYAAQNPATTIDHHDVATVWRDGYYIFILSINPTTSIEYNATMTVRMLGDYGYLSAVDWPLLIFYGVMGLVYIVLGLIWLVVIACNWRDLLRVQYWIGGVIFLATVEMAILYAEYQSTNNSGVSVTTEAIIIATLVFSLKSAFTRMLILIVTIGFGIVKRYRRRDFYKVLFFGGLYFIVTAISRCISALQPRGYQSTEMMLATIPCAIVDLFFCVWILLSLRRTIRKLGYTGNSSKLPRYKYFAVVIIFTVLASIVFTLWSINQIHMKQCITDWRDLWIDHAFWHLLFSVILIVIMFLWRPSTNNQSILDDEPDKNQDLATTPLHQTDGNNVQMKDFHLSTGCMPVNTQI